ncbi:hypothetical protein SDC9_180384 [bioreactor metagenome]|uniref:Uncharacterized protein n=1 Tax=bioreactor metagenome TaxID=1076179 RepID=A0A645H1L5_9ZZZZ
MNIFAPDLIDRGAVNQYFARVQFIKAHQQVDNGGLAGTGRADDRNLLPRPDMGREIIDNRLILCIAKVNMPELHIASDVLKLLDFFALVAHFRFIKQLKDTLARGGGSLQVLKSLGNL